MFHIRQECGDDCGIATAAMVGGTSYIEVIEESLSLSLPERGLKVVQMKRLLEGITQTKWTICWTSWCPDVSKLRLLEGPLVVVVQGDGWYHWIAMKSSIVHDPGFPGPLTLFQYPHKHCKVPAFLKPVDAALLNACQGRRRQRILEQLAVDLPVGKETRTF
jgi:hypothetical protein